MTLDEWLYRYGWNRDDALAAAVAFDAETEVTSKARSAAATAAWMDDEQHDYSGEMLDCIAGWLCDQISDLQEKLAWHERGCPQGTGG